MALQSIKISNGDANTGLQQDSATAINEIIKKLAERTEIIADTDTSWVYQDRPAYHQYFLSDKAQIGRFATQGPHSGLYLFSGKAFSAKRRKVNGLLLVSDTGGTPDYTAYPTKDTLLVKAAATIYSNDGRLPSLYDLNREQFLRDHL
jgi:hypothetical protein